MPGVEVWLMAEVWLMPGLEVWLMVEKVWLPDGKEGREMAGLELRNGQ